MATVALRSIGSLAGPVGSLVGAYVGSWIDADLIGSLRGPQWTNSPLANQQVTGYDEGVPLPRVYGTARTFGRLIWATDFEHAVVEQKTTGSGGKGTPQPAVTTRTHVYYANFAMALCEGPVQSVGRIWLDNNLISSKDIVYRTYTGTEDQPVDTLIEAKETNPPAYRGVAYIVFERLPIAEFGNRIPTVQVEILRTLSSLESDIRSVAVIPGSGEFFCATTPISREINPGETALENRHHHPELSNIEVSMDQLKAVCPNVERISLVISWFGDDLRVGQCSVFPAVETKTKVTKPQSWSVGGITRSQAREVSSDSQGRASYGGTPSDASVLEGIAAAKKRGLKVTLLPFLLMDIPAGSTKASPYGGTQGAFPWRGRITCDPAPGAAGTVDGTAAAASQVSNFFGNATRSQFDTSSDTITYNGSDEFSWSRMILHYAYLAAKSGGVDTFVIGTEFVGISRVRSSRTTTPAAAELAALAAEVRAILPDTSITYAADWSEYGSYSPPGASGDLLFPLDNLWASSNIDAVGVDAYLPLSDWRHEASAPDRVEGWNKETDPAYLSSRLNSGENWDWYYASDTARLQQQRTPITDGAENKPWVYRSKDFASWWSNQHFPRFGGVESASPTAWVPGSKPIWFTEAGCPAIDGGARTPWRFYDAKSTSPSSPPHSDLVADPEAQRAYLEAFLGGYSPQGKYFDPTLNPEATLYSGRMIDFSRITLWAWDARPYPAFPDRVDVWSDGVNYDRGHWLNGRLGKVGIGRLLEGIATDAGLTILKADGVTGLVDGYVIDAIRSTKFHIEPILRLWGLQAIEQDGQLVILPLGSGSSVSISYEELVGGENDKTLLQWDRPAVKPYDRQISLNYIEPRDNYKTAAVLVGTPNQTDRNLETINVPIIVHETVAASLARSYLHRIKRQDISVDFSLGPKFLHLEVGDRVRLNLRDGTSENLEIIKATGLLLRQITARRSFIPWRDTVRGGSSRRSHQRLEVIPPVSITVVDLPKISSRQEFWRPLVAARTANWPSGGVGLFSSPGFSASGVGSFTGVAQFSHSATLATLQENLLPGVSGRRDWSQQVTVVTYGDALASATHGAVLNGANVLAILATNGEWEIIQFDSAELISTNTYRLSGILRGQFGTEPAMIAGSSAQTRCVVVDESLAVLPISLDARELSHRLRAVPANASLTDASATEVTFVPSSVGLRPRAVASLRAQWSGDTGDNLEVTWLRRARYGGDSWQGEVPLEDDVEAYQVRIFALPVASGSSAIWSKVHQVVAGSAQPSISISRAELQRSVPSQTSKIQVFVAQIGTLYGEGSPSRLEVSL